MPRLDDASPLVEDDAPLVSLLVPAKDEAQTIGHGLSAKLALDYPNLEVIVIDDRSTDGTGDIARKFAARDPRVRVHRIDELPAGWLGKVHALEQGMRVARGEWVLMSDADVMLAPDSLSRAVSMVKDADFVAVFPHFQQVSIATDALMDDFLRTAMLFADARRIENPQSSFAAGGGVFNLVRRSAYTKTAGLAWIKLEVGDDVAFGQMMKRSGARCRIADGARHVKLVLYPSVPTFVRGMSKGAWPILARFSVLRLVVACGLVLLWNLAPFAIIAAPVASDAARALAGIAVLLNIGNAASVSRHCGRNVATALLAPIAGAVTAVVMFCVALNQAVRGGITWRGTFYANDVLRAGRRLTMPWEK